MLPPGGWSQHGSSQEGLDSPLNHAKLNHSARFEMGSRVTTSGNGAYTILGHFICKCETFVHFASVVM